MANQRRWPPIQRRPFAAIDGVAGEETDRNTGLATSCSFIWTHFEA
jgi:hypothetical protein